MQIDLALKDEKEATFGKNKHMTEPNPELMQISLNDFGESDTDSAIDFLSPKDSPLNRIPGAPTSGASVFQFNNSTVPPSKIEEELESENEELESEEEFDIKDVTKGLFERVLQEELKFCMNINQRNEVQQKTYVKPPSYISEIVSEDWNTDLDHSDIDRNVSG